MAVNPLTWALHRKLSLRDGVEFTLDGMPYLVDVVNCDKRVTNIKKGTQVCLTTTKYIEALHACVYRKYNQNILYMMPTSKQAELLAKVSFDPIFDFNPWLKRMVSTNTATSKEINGRSIVFVGGKPQKVGGHTKDSANLRSIPADRVDRDEIDLMDPEMVEMSKQRLNRSEFRIENNFGSPTYPGYGIDFLYDQSDRRKWQIKCGSCGKYTCLAERFPDTIIQKDGRWFRACIHCHNEIFVRDGEWIADYPDRREAGFWVSGLLSPFADLDEYMYRYHNSEGSKLSEFMRSILGIATTEAENQLSREQVLQCTSRDLMCMSSKTETVMGVDVGGSVLHCVTGIRTGTDTFQILNLSRVDSFEDVLALADRMNTRFLVIDYGPEYHQTRKLQQDAPFTVYRCQYSESTTQRPDFNAKTGIVKCNRNEWCDKVHEVVSTERLSIPRSSKEVDEFAEELTKTARTVEEHPETGVPKPKWLKLGDKADHYFHATLYFLLGASRTSPTKVGEKRTRYRKARNDFHI